MAVTPSDIMRLGKFKLYEFLQIESDEEFKEYMLNEVKANPYDIQAFSEYMSQYYKTCDSCGQQYTLLAEISCDECEAAIKNRF